MPKQSKSKIKIIKENLSPQEAVDDIIRGFIENGYRELWAMYPFREGKIKSFYAPGRYLKYGSTQPLTKEQISDIEKLIGQKLTLASLRAFLIKKVGIQNCEPLTWDDILLILQNYYEKDNIQWDKDPNCLSSSEAREKLYNDFGIRRSLSWFTQRFNKGDIRGKRKGQNLKVFWLDVVKYIDKKSLKKPRFIKEATQEAQEKILSKIIKG